MSALHGHRHYICSAFALRASCQQKFYEVCRTDTESAIALIKIILLHQCMDLIRSQIAGHHADTKLVVIVYRISGKIETQRGNTCYSNACCIYQQYTQNNFHLKLKFLIEILQYFLFKHNSVEFTYKRNL